MTNWRGILLTAIALTGAGLVVHTIESMLTLAYYMDPTYFGVWSKLMMPAAGPPPTTFYYYSVAFALLGWGVFAFVYDKLGRAIEQKCPIRRGLKFGALVFLIAGIPGALTMYLLINLPTGLLAVWTLDQLILYLIGGVVAAKLIGLK